MVLGLCSHAGARACKLVRMPPHSTCAPQSSRPHKCAQAAQLRHTQHALVPTPTVQAHAFRPTRSSPGMRRLPSSSTLCTDLRGPAVRAATQLPAGTGCMPKAATASPPGGDLVMQEGSRARLAEDAADAAEAGAAPAAGGGVGVLQRDTPATCMDVFSTGLYAAAAGAVPSGPAAVAAAAGAAAAGGGLRGAASAFRRPHSFSGHGAGANGGGPLAAAPALRSRHSSPPAAGACAYLPCWACMGLHVCMRLCPVRALEGGGRMRGRLCLCGGAWWACGHVYEHCVPSAWVRECFTLYVA